MALAKKGKRKIVFNQEEYYWWVEDNFDGSNGHQVEVTVATDDKQFLVKYYLDQRENFFVTVLGPKFSVDIVTGECWKRFASPKFGESKLFTPKNVSELLEWCLDPKKVLIEVDFKGDRLNV